MDELTAEAKGFFTRPFDGVIRIELESDDRSLWIDGREAPPVVSENAPAGLDGRFCLWRTNRETLDRLLGDPPQQLESIYIAGRLKISGDMAVMARLETVSGN